MVEDLNTLYYFTQVVEHRGFAAAGRALDMPKSKLSRRIAQLEERLGVRLIQRSTSGVWPCASRPKRQLKSLNEIAPNPKALCV